ncbi:hypothetical protein IVA80_31940 [Bradyrhizobium sp. 139]|uniref:hypothetical protein n=1 Tax=Bradyrhizobium sp. 139 TaxID=2782616 RepID=UPI001FF9270E|nr:hypothetical protein [Bradyrhizobium sp. 139]MCK1745275.1 hypothetical protein [Bradyrhizobium sp. 139]
MAIAGDCANGTLFTFMPDSTTNAAGAAAVAKLNGSSLSSAGCMLYAYAAVQAWAGSVKRAGTLCHAGRCGPTSGSIETAIATVRFDSKGDNAAPGFIVYRWRDNTVEAVAQT